MEWVINIIVYLFVFPLYIACFEGNRIIFKIIISFSS